MAPAEFVHLHVHSEYSLLDGACRIDALTEYAAGLGMRALALTDHGVMFGALNFYQACRRHGIKPIVGCEVYLAPGSRLDREGVKPFHLTLLAADRQGYRHLLQLVSRGYTEGFYGKPRIDYDLLSAHNAGLICLSGCLNGPLARPLAQGQPQVARHHAGRLHDLFGPRLYIELQDHGLAEQVSVNRGLLELAGVLAAPVVATNDVHYLRRSDARLHDLLLCIGTNKTEADRDRLRFPNDQFYLKTAAEMAERFAHLPEAVRNTLAVSEQCNLELNLGQVCLPEFTLPPGFTSDLAYLRHLCLQQLPNKYPAAGPEVHARLEHELTVIGRMGYAGYFLVVWDFVDYARRQEIPVGPGRGSGAGSLAAYLLGITGVDPLARGLLFERFLNPERVDLPDFDIDFCYERRGEVIAYVTRRYGTERVAQIISFGTLAARAAVRDMGRALGLPYGEVDRVAKTIPAIGADLNTALEKVPELRQLVAGSPQLEDLLHLARQVEGMPRHASVHAAGVVIAPDPLMEHVPLYRHADGGLVTQFDMDQLKEIGLLKMDFLGLRTLTVIDRTVRWLRQRQPDFNLERIPLDDPAVYRMLADGHTIGLFQLEAAWVADVLRQMKPARFEDIVAAISLCRPGPMEYIPDYIAAKEQGAHYRHPDLEPILRDTHGVMIYQEQIMQVAAQVAGFSLGQADLLRRAVSKKKREELEKYRELFTAGALARGYAPELIDQLYRDILKFAGYGFNRAHAAAYAVLAYQTAYLKHHHRVEFMAALLSSVMGSEGKVALYMGECRRLRIPVLAPDVNESGPAFMPVQSRAAIRFGLTAVKNVGQGAVEEIVAARRSRGPCTGLEDFLGRTEGRHLNRKAVESLIKAGALDSLGHTRVTLLHQLDMAMEAAHRRQRLSRHGQISLFDLNVADPEVAVAAEPEPAATPPPDLRQAYLAMEKEVLGFFVSGHPLAGREEELLSAGCLPVAALEDGRDGSRVAVGGLLTGARRISTRSGGIMAFLQVEDLTGTLEVIVFPRILERCRHVLREGAALVVHGRLQLQEDGAPKLLADEVHPLDGRPAKAAPVPAGPAPGAVLYLRVDAAGWADPALQQVRAALARFSGTTRVRIKLTRANRWIEVDPPHRVTLNPQLLQELRSLLGPRAVVTR